MREARCLWGKNSVNIMYFCMWPLAYLIALKDRIEGKVRYSHREFIINKDIAHITIESLNSDIF